MEFNKCYSMFDLYGFKPHLYINGYGKKETNLGLIFSLLTWLFMITITIYYGNKLFINKELQTLTSVRSATSEDYIYINKDNFFFAFALEDPKYNIYIDEEVYYPVVYYRHGVRTPDGQFNYSDSIRLTCEPCKASNFGEQFQDLVKLFPLENMYCIKDLDFSLTGNFASDEYSFIVLTLYTCKNTSEITCKSTEEIDYLLDGAYFTFQYQNFIFDPNDFNEPYKPRIGDFMTTVSKKYFKNVYAYLKKYLLNTDTGLIFESKNEKIMTLYDSGSDMLSFETTRKLLQLTFRMSLDVNEISRSYTKAQTVISYLGGFITFLQTFFKLLTDFLTHNYIYENIINKIFFFNKDDEIKKLKKNYKISLAHNTQNLLSNKNLNIYNNPINKNKSNNNSSIDNTNLNSINKSSLYNLNDNSLINKDENSKINIKNDNILDKILNNPRKNSSFLILNHSKIQSSNKNESSKSDSNSKNKESNKDLNRKNYFFNNNYDNIFTTKNIFFNKGEQKSRKKLYNSYFKRLFYFCWKEDSEINLFYKGITIMKNKLDIISIIKDSFHLELIKKFIFGKEHIILLDNFIKAEIMDYNVNKNKTDIDKDIIVDDDIVKSFKIIYNRNKDNNYKNEEKAKIDKYFIDIILRQNN